MKNLKKLGKKLNVKKLKSIKGGFPLSIADTCKHNSMVWCNSMESCVSTKEYEMYCH